MESEEHEISTVKVWLYGVGKIRGRSSGDLYALERRDRFFGNKDLWKLQTTSPAFPPYLLPNPWFGSLPMA
jgi:hypothetical protein